MQNHKCLPENVSKIPENADTRYAGGPSTGFYNSLVVFEATHGELKYWPNDFGCKSLLDLGLQIFLHFIHITDNDH